MVSLNSLTSHWKKQGLRKEKGLVLSHTGGTASEENVEHSTAII